MGLGAALIVLLLRLKYIDESPMWAAHNRELHEAAKILENNYDVCVNIVSEEATRPGPRVLSSAHPHQPHVLVVEAPSVRGWRVSIHIRMVSRPKFPPEEVQIFVNLLWEDPFLDFLSTIGFFTSITLPLQPYLAGIARGPGLYGLLHSCAG